MSSLNVDENKEVAFIFYSPTVEASEYFSSPGPRRLAFFLLVARFKTKNENG